MKAHPNNKQGLAGLNSAATLLFLAWWNPAPCTADIYKYQDEQGRWHFTDQAAPGSGEPVIRTERKSSVLSVNIEKKLQDKYQPETPLEQASLGVVEIQGTIKRGTGFFISADGYILTSKHVVKPASASSPQALQERVAATEKAYRESRTILRGERDRLLEMEELLEKYKKDIEQENVYDLGILRAEYELTKIRHDKYSRQYERLAKECRAKKKEYENAKSAYNVETSLSTLRKDFIVRLKDHTALTAHLISISDNHDLALLKIDSYHTPGLRPAANTTVEQGMKIYVISGLPGKHSVTGSGTVISMNVDYVITDTRVVPGSSGSPLVSASGDVIGINSISLSDTFGSGDFGAAIPIDVAFREFGNYISRQQKPR